MSSSNGVYRTAAAARPGSDPFAKVLSSGPRVPAAVTIGFAVLLHVGAAAGATAAALYDEISAYQRVVRETVAARLAQYEMDVVKEPEPPPPPPPPEEPPPEKENTPPPPPVAQPKDTPPPPPEAAQAGKVLTSDPDPNEPVDLTNSFVQGNGNYAGGSTASNGTSAKPVYNPAAAATGVPGGTGTTAAPPGPDRSRAPGLLGSVDWNDCPFPGEADAEQIDQSFAMIQVKVKPDGAPESVTVVQDPGHGFGREAKKCAMRKRFSPGLDAAGNPVGGMTKPFRVRFER